MSAKQILVNVIIRYVLFLLFMYFLISTISSSGWGFFAILFALVATNDFVQAVRLTQVYFKIKNNSKK